MKVRGVPSPILNFVCSEVICDVMCCVVALCHASRQVGCRPRSLFRKVWKSSIAVVTCAIKSSTEGGEVFGWGMKDRPGLRSLIRSGLFTMFRSVVSTCLWWSLICSGYR